MRVAYLYFHETWRYDHGHYPQQPAHSRPFIQSCSKVKMSIIRWPPEINNLIRQLIRIEQHVRHKSVPAVDPRISGNLRFTFNPKTPWNLYKNWNIISTSWSLLINFSFLLDSNSQHQSSLKFNGVTTIYCKERIIWWQTHHLLCLMIEVWTSSDSKVSALFQ